MAFDVINEDNVYLCVGHPLRKDINAIVDWLLNKDFLAAQKGPVFSKWSVFRFICKTFPFLAICELKIRKGLALQDILSDVHQYVHRRKLS